MVKKNGKPPVQTIKYSFQKILTGSDLSSRRLAVMEVKSVKPGPSVWLTGCMHGDEVGGIVVIQEVFRRLRKSPLNQGSLHAFPLMNPVGFETATRHLVLSSEDLNRSFPGNPDGSLAERLAHRIFTAVTATGPALVLDLHNDWIKSIPYTLIDPYPGTRHREVWERVKTYAKKTGFPVIQETGQSGLQKTLSGALLSRGVPALTLELGEAFVVNERNVEDGARSIWALLALLGMVEPRPEPVSYEPPKPFKGRRLQYLLEPTASVSGIIRFSARAGEVVKKGQKIARIYNVFGKLTQTLTAPEDGLVLGAADSSVALPGRPVMAFGVLPSARAAEAPAEPAPPEPDQAAQ